MTVRASITHHPGPARMAGPSPEFCAFVLEAILAHAARRKASGLPSPPVAVREEISRAVAELQLGTWSATAQDGPGLPRVAASPRAADSAGAGSAVGVEPELVGVDEASRLLNVSTRTVARLAGSGDLPSRKVGARRMFARVDVREYARRGGGQ